jgi:hypothetical protein
MGCSRSIEIKKEKRQPFSFFGVAEGFSLRAVINFGVQE